MIVPARNDRPDSTFDDQGAGSTLSSFLRLAGQTWIDDTRGIEQTPLVLTGRRYARVQNFSVETLAVAASSVRVYMQEQLEEDGEPKRNGADERKMGKTAMTKDTTKTEESEKGTKKKLPAKVPKKKTPAKIQKKKLQGDCIVTAEEPDDDRLDLVPVGDVTSRHHDSPDTGAGHNEPTDDAKQLALSNGDLMREQLMNIVEKKNESLTSLYRPDGPGFTKAQQAHLRALGKAAREGGLDMWKEFNF